ncbi:SOS response-associated peptidase [Rhodopila sp.]|uniref:SOS response-associated peptidase n=1 Tax=Rhodopila sp. TaxID=2480087 RepID=UPI002C58AEF0|nr:SOS response-associated peptidase [Rhodopila sp.]HVZ08949.1 SOS response-associated peptidase [Rhodopila sp.]
MCGRYVSSLPAEALVALLDTVGPTPNWAPTWNMAPTRDAPVVRRHPATGERRLDLLRWGLVPHWAKDPKTVRLSINARSETLSSTPMFRDAYARKRRCLVPADAFYEWQVVAGGKIPHAVARADGQPMIFAGLWEGWRGADGTVIRSFVIITTDANETLRPLHERMPVVLEPDAWPLWLGEREGDVAGLLRPSEAMFRVWRVGTAVNNVRNDAAELLAAV